MTLNPNPIAILAKNLPESTKNPTPCSNTTTQLLDLAGIGTPGPMQCIPARAIQYRVRQNQPNPAVGV